MDGGGNACASFQPHRGEGEGKRDEEREREREGLSPFTGSSFNRKRKPAPSALLACQPACLPASLPVTAISPFYPLFRSGFTEIFPLFSWWPGSDWREIRNSIDSLHSGCRTEFGYFSRDTFDDRARDRDT